MKPCLCYNSMDVEGIILSEISQREKNKYITHVVYKETKQGNNNI